MKKKIFITMLAVFMLTIFSVTACAFTLGDVNGDGAVKAADARLALRYSAKLEELSEEQLGAADVDNSGKVTASDARKILRVAASLDKFEDAPEITKHLIEDGVLNVAVCTDNAPFAYEENGVVKGIDIEIINAIADYYTLDVKFHIMEKDRIEDSLNNGTCDIAISGLTQKNMQNSACSNVYYTNIQSVLLLNKAGVHDYKGLVGDGSMKIGVIRGSVADLSASRPVEKGGLGAENVVRFDNYIDIGKALKNDQIYAIVMDEANADIVYGVYASFTKHKGNYADDKYVICSAKEKTELIENINKALTNKNVVSVIKKYTEKADLGTITASCDKIVLSKGGSATFFVDTYFPYAEETIYTKGFCVLVFSQDRAEKSPAGMQRFIITVLALPDSTSGEIEVVLNYRNSVKIPVEIVNNTNSTYQVGYSCSVPDFGAFTKTAPYDMELEQADGIIGFGYGGNDLYNNGITTIEQLNAYLDLVEKNGFTCIGEETGYDYYMLAFMNEKTNEVMTYMEGYDENGNLIAVAIAFSYNFR